MPDPVVAAGSFERCVCGLVKNNTRYHRPHHSKTQILARSLLVDPSHPLSKRIALLTPYISSSILRCPTVGHEPESVPAAWFAESSGRYKPPRYPAGAR